MCKEGERMGAERPWINLVDGAFYGNDPYPAFKWMRANEPVYFDEATGIWGITKHRDIKDVSKDPQTFSSAGGIRPDQGALPMMIDMDAPAHVERRRLVSAGFTPVRVRAMEEGIRQVCDGIIDAVIEEGRCDLVADIAAPLPLIVIGDMLGVAPEDRGELLRWSDDLMKGQGSEDPELLEAMMTAFIEYTAYMTEVIEDRRRTGKDDDLVGILVHAGDETGGQLDTDSLIHETLLIVIGGDETTRHVISGGVEALLANPGQFAALREDPALIPKAIEEMLRWVTPIKNMARTTTRDAQIRGTTIPEGDKLLLLYPSANRDEEVFIEPERFDIARTPNDHVAFGFGAHFCLGNQLARMEMRTMLEQLCARVPDLARADDAAIEHRDANFVSGIESLAVTFTPGPRVGTI
jgi:cytochrome P450 family 142 subfamily A polypeptide 1